MASVLNNTARQYNVKQMSKSGNVMTCRLVPGLNIVDDAAWKLLEKDSYVVKLQEEGSLEVSTPRVKRLENDFESEPHKAEAKTKNVPKKRKKVVAED